MAPLLPDLVFTLDFVSKLEGSELLQEDFGPVALQQVDQLTRREHLEALHGIGEFGRRRNHVEVIFEDHVTVDHKLPVLWQETSAVEQDLNRFWPSEDGNP